MINLGEYRKNREEQKKQREAREKKRGRFEPITNKQLI